MPGDLSPPPVGRWFFLWPLSMLILLLTTTAFSWVGVLVLYSMNDPVGGGLGLFACFDLTVAGSVAGLLVLSLATGDLLREASEWSVLALVFAGLVCLGNLVVGFSYAFA